MDGGVTIGDCTLILGDCRNLSITIPDSAVVTDPPYGLGKKWRGGFNGLNGKSRVWPDKEPEWDAQLFDPEFICGLAGRSRTIIWGGNYYPLPPCRGWLLWDKVQSFSGADCEMAWTNLDIPVRAFRMSRIDAYKNKSPWPKAHPNEKPLALMKWCLSFLPDGCAVTDYFMGSGTTAIACIHTGRKFIGIELSEEYFNIAVKRVRAEYERQPLFTSAD